MNCAQYIEEINLVINFECILFIKDCAYDNYLAPPIIIIVPIVNAYMLIIFTPKACFRYTSLTTDYDQKHCFLSSFHLKFSLFTTHVRDMELKH